MFNNFDAQYKIYAKGDLIMKVAVLGSGNGGVAVAADWALAGHDVSIFDFEQFLTQIEAISKNKGIYVEGDIEGFAKVKYAGHDIEKVMDEADIIFVVGPAYSTKSFAEAAKAYLKKGQKVVVCPGSCGGSIVFKNALGLDIKDDSIIISEYSTLPYACRITEPGKVKVFLKLKGGLFLATVPSKHTDEVYDIVKTVYPCTVKAKNVLQTTLQNANPIIHPSVTLLNAGLIERTGGDFYFYEEGVMPGVGRLMEAVDNERIALGEKLGIKVIPDPELGMMQGYMQEANYETGYSTANGFKGIKAQNQLDHRYLNEDVGYGLVFMSELGKQIGVSTPIMDSVIHIASAVMKKDYRKEKIRTMESLGLAKYTVEELAEIL